MNASNSEATQSGGPPIGFLLRKLDRLINERFEVTLGTHDITRRQWQLMNTLAEGDTSVEVLTAAVAPFLDRPAGDDVTQHLAPLAENGFVRARATGYALTDAGRHLLQRLRVEVQTIRDVSTTGLADGEYERTVSTLQIMVGNLESGDTAG